MNDIVIMISDSIVKLVGQAGAMALQMFINLDKSKHKDNQFNYGAYRKQLVDAGLVDAFDNPQYDKINFLRTNAGLACKNYFVYLTPFIEKGQIVYEKPSH